jgi:HlyD family secretion protein
VLEVRFAEGDAVPAGAVVAVLDDRDAQAKLHSKAQELGVADAEIATAEERVQLVQTTWERTLTATLSDVKQAETTAAVAARTFQREAELVKTGASTTQLLDDARMRRDQAGSALERAHAMAARVRAEERSTTVAQHELSTLRERRELAQAQLEELRVTAAKYQVHAPDVATVVQTQHLWPGELAQPGSPLVTVLDPRDKYVQVYVPVADVGDFTIGRKVQIELDSRPGERTPGEVTFVADQASFTPDKIETRDDRMGQVYRAKIRILEDVEGFQAGTDGNVSLTP